MINELLPRHMRQEPKQLQHWAGDPKTTFVILRHGGKGGYSAGRSPNLHATYSPVTCLDTRRMHMGLDKGCEEQLFVTTE